ncbi:MAG: alpha/beta hydrolase [SAR324 cluster bacterium]|nr:alpha/beta hydrolase [SAR324 cluster bacterium]
MTDQPRRKLEFLHANGFPAGSYRQLFQNFEDFDVHFVESLGQFEGGLPQDWESIADQVLSQMNFHQPSVGVGHSLGAVVLLYAAAQRPEAFTDIILLDPPLFSWCKRASLWLLKKFGKMDRVTPAHTVLRRRETFSSHQEAFDQLRKRSFFRKFSDEVLTDYVAKGFIAQVDCVKLRIPKELEYHIFQTIPLHFSKSWKGLKGHLVFASHKGILQQSDRNELRRALPGFQQTALNGGHMFPLEQPEKTAEMIRTLINSRN